MVVAALWERFIVLCSGDLGATLCPAKSLDEMLPFMAGFHQRHMNSNQVCRYRAHMAAGMDIAMIVPPHGRAFAGRAVGQSPSSSRLRLMA